MANREKGYGLSREVAARMDAKYSEEDEQVVVAWMTAILGDSPANPGRDVSNESNRSKKSNDAVTKKILLKQTSFHY